MKKTVWAFALSLAAVLGLAVGAAADDDIDLPINGDFRGTASGYSPAPGWTLTADGGSARILPTTDRDDFILELQAAPNRAQSVVSGMHRMPGGVLKLELKLSGAGTAEVGYEAYDAAQRTVVSADRLTIPLSAYDQKIKRYFTLTARADFIRIRLTAGAGSTARFRDVDADVSGFGMQLPAAATVAAPAPGTIAAPAPGTIAAPAPGTIAAPAAQPAPVAAPAPAAQPAPVAAPAPAAQPAPVAAPAPAAQSAVQPAAAAATAPRRLLRNDEYYSYRFLGNDEHFETSLPVGSDIDFNLGEDADSGLYWRVASYDASVCRVKLEHDRDGVFPIRWDKAEIELKALRPGRTDVVFTCGTKRVTVHFTAL